MHRDSGLRSRRVVLVIAPLAVLTVLGLIFFGRPLLGSPSASALASAQLGPIPTAAHSTAAAEAAATQAAEPKLTDLGVAKGSFSLKGPAAAKGGFVVFVVDGPKRVVRTDASAPFSVKLNTKALPNGTYTVTVLSTRKGKSSVVSTSTLRIKNPKPKPKPTPTASKPGSGGSGGSGGGSSTGTNSSYTSQVLSLTNVERAKVGCKALSEDSRLTKAAQDHSADMAAKNYFSHDSQDGRSPFDRMKDVGYSFSAAAENIAMGQQTPASVMDAWMNSPGHKANILNCTYTELGVGYAVNKSGAPYWTQDFGKPL
jgi:uncharacterized protein YkwD